MDIPSFLTPMAVPAVSLQLQCGGPSSPANSTPNVAPNSVKTLTASRPTMRNCAKHCETEIRRSRNSPAEHPMRRPVSQGRWNTMKQHDDRRGREFPPRWSIALILLVLLGFLAWTVWSINTSKQEADDAATNANSLADEVTNACAEGSVEIDGRDICAKAKQVKKDVAEPTKAGPAGPQGVRGRPGPRSTIPGPTGQQGGDGEDSDVPGPAGEKGQDSDIPGPAGIPGEDSEVPGPRGERGAPGSDGETVVGPPGPAGAKGEKGESVTGPPGSKGEKGESGRGISGVTCTSGGDWKFTFTDDTSITVDGPCRVSSLRPPRNRRAHRHRNRDSPTATP